MIADEQDGARRGRGAPALDADPEYAEDAGVIDQRNALGQGASQPQGELLNGQQRQGPGQIGDQPRAGA